MARNEGDQGSEQYSTCTSSDVLETAPTGVRLIGTLIGQGGVIGDVAWSPDGSLLATVSTDGTVVIWDGTSHQHLHTLSAPGVSLCTTAFDYYGRYIAAASRGGVVILWEVGSWQAVKTVDLRNNSTGSCDSISFSPAEDLLAVGGINCAAIVDVGHRYVRHRLHDGAGIKFYEVSFDSFGARLATASSAGVQVWDPLDGQLLTALDGHGSSVSVAFSRDDQLLVSCGPDKTIKVWDLRSGNLFRILEGHTGGVNSLSFTADGRLLASGGTDGSVRLWDCATWSPVGVIADPASRRHIRRLAWHPRQPLLATAVTSDEEYGGDFIRLWQVDPDLLVSQSRPSSIAYASAKIVLVGESGAGKTGLGYRLAHGRFKDHPSTHGQQFWVLDELTITRADGAQCEAVLWDLAGQPDYRLIHSLFLDDADLALIVFDPTRDDDPLQSVDYWVRQLGGADPSAAEGGKTRLILVAARSDRGDSRLTADEIARFCAERGIHAHVSTSALTGYGLANLVDWMRRGVDWASRPTTVTTETFKWIKDAVLRLKESPGELVIVSQVELRELLERDDPGRRFTDAEMVAAVGHLAKHGYVTLLRTSRGESRVLLMPELLNNVAASMVLEARRNPKGLGSLEEQRVLAGGYPFPELNNLTHAEQDILLDSAAAMFLAHNVCFRETDPLSSRVYLVFPELINLKRPTMQAAQPVSDGAAYTVTGVTQNVYASLVVLLGYTDVFTRTNQWRNQAQYVVGADKVCGFRLEAEREGELELALYFEATVGEPIRMLFQGLFESFLARRDLTVRRLDPVSCSNGHQLNRAAVREQLADGNDAAFCMRCGEGVPLLRADVPIQIERRHRAALDRQRLSAEQRSRFEQALYRVTTSRPTATDRQPTCFVSYAWGDRAHEQWVERDLASDLAKAGITVILDRWENARIGASVPRFVERVVSADWVIVVGTPAYLMKYDNDEPMGGFVVAAEGDLIGNRLIGTESRKQTVLPVLLEGTVDTSLPPLLRGRVYADFRQADQYFLTAFSLILSVHGVRPNDPLGVELRAYIEGSS